jgi:hypothetical protein
MWKHVLVITLVWSGTAAAQQEEGQPAPQPQQQEDPQEALRRRIEQLRQERLRQQQRQQQQQPQQQAPAAVAPRTQQQVEQPAPPPEPPKPPRPPEPPIAMPQLFRMPTGHLLPAGVLFTSSGLDTGAGFSSNAAVGLGDVAEFGLEVNDFVRATDATINERDPHRVYPTALALFKVGVGERRLWSWQPAMSIGFRKSFEKDDGAHTTREAELFFVMSKSVTKRVGLHAGASFWDAELDNNTLDPAIRTTYLHGDPMHPHDLGDQVRAFGGINMEPFDGSEILVELMWTPEFTYRAPKTDEMGNQIGNNDSINLKPILAWGVRYRVADWMYLESGVRVPDIGNADLLHAQIFGQVKFVSRALAHAIHGD